MIKIPFRYSSSVSKLGLGKGKLKGNSFQLPKSFLEKSRIEVEEIRSDPPRNVASNSPLTGVVAGRTIEVKDGNIYAAMSRLNGVIRSNKIPQMSRDQRFYTKPGKVKAQKKSERKKERFMEGFKDLMRTVKEAKRKGY